MDSEEEEAATEAASEVEVVTVEASEEAEVETVEVSEAAVVAVMASREAEAVVVPALAEVLECSLNLMKDSKESTFSEARMTPYLLRTSLLERVSTMRREFLLM